MGWSASSGRLWLCPFSFPVKLCSRVCFLSGKTFAPLLQLEYVKYCEFWRMHFNIFHFLKSFDWLSFIAAIFILFCEEIIKIATQKLIHIVFLLAFFRRAVYILACLFSPSDTSINMYLNIFYLEDSDLLSVLYVFHLYVHDLYMVWHCVYIIFPIESTVYSWMFHAILLPKDRLFCKNPLKKKTSK